MNLSKKQKIGFAILALITVGGYMYFRKSKKAIAVAPATNTTTTTTTTISTAKVGYDESGKPRELTDAEAQSYLDNNADLSTAYGANGILKAKEHWITWAAVNEPWRVIVKS